jgi:hypothetical protein
MSLQAFGCPLDQNGLCPHSWTWSLLVGFLFLVVYLFIAAVATKHKKPWEFLRSGDGRLSTSKFQFFVWTGVVVFTFTLYQFARYYNSHWELFDNYTSLPVNVLWAMGMAAGTSVVAKGIAASFDASGRTANVPKDKKAPDTGLVASDDGSPDLSKIQMLTWTVIAVVAYLASAVHGFNAFALCDPTPQITCNFPDISTTLLTLMGIGQAGYLGAKLTTVESPRITAAKPPADVAGKVVTLTGQDFGPVDGLITIDGVPLATPYITWADAQIQFTFPAMGPGGMAWPPGKSVSVGLVVNGLTAANTMPLAP